MLDSRMGASRFLRPAAMVADAWAHQLVGGDEKWKRVERVAGLQQPPEFRPLRHDMHAHERLAMAAR